MSKLTPRDLQKLARLAALELGDRELDSLTADLEQILDYVEKLNTLDTHSMEPLSQPTSRRLREREDRPEQQLEREDILRNAPEIQEEMFRVPPVLDGEEG